MKVLIARTSGFCHGVRRAMRIALQAAAQHGGLHADGPLVHNRQAVELLAIHGVRESAPPEKPTLIRAHGVAPEQKAAWQAEGRKLIDATCPRVAANQKLAEQSARENTTILFAGDTNHAESKAVAGCAPEQCIIICTPEEAQALTLEGPVVLMAQTTFSVDQFNAIADVVKTRFPNHRIIDTICRATHDRQEETARLARQADALVVVGGKHSANTQRLAEVGRAAGIPVYCIETANELRDEDFADIHTVAVTSGASTPGWISQDVVNRLRNMGRGSLQSSLYRILLPLVETRATTAIAAAGYALACSMLSLQAPDFLLALAGACFVFFAHTVNRRVPPDAEARRVSLVDAYYQSHRWLFIVACAVAAVITGAAGYIAGGIEILLFFAVLFLAALAFKQSRFSRNIPMSAGWALALAGPAVWLSGWRGESLCTGVFVFLVCFAGTLVRDLHDSASDHLMGIKTLAARHGPEYATRLAYGIFKAALGFAILAGAFALTGRARAVAFGLILVPLAGMVLLRKIGRNHMHDSILVQAGVDALGWLAGCIAVGGMAA